MTSDSREYLRSVYGGKILDPCGFGRRLYDGEMTPDEFRTLFTVYDPRPGSRLPSLGMFITVRLTGLLLMDGLAEWTLRIAKKMKENRKVRAWVQSALCPARHLTCEDAEETMRNSPQVRRVLIAGTLKEFGLAACSGWVDQASVLNGDDEKKNVPAEIILQHLIEADVEETRAFLGVNPQYDASELWDVLGGLRFACADTARCRTPQLFLYHGHKLGLADEQLCALIQWVIAAGHHFTQQQKHELVNADWQLSGVQMFLREQWDIPA